MRFVGFIGPSYTLKSPNVDSQRCINLYPELDELGTGKEREVASLVATPGLSLLVTIGAGPGRGTVKATDGNLYVVSGNTLYKVSSSWVATSLGTISTSTGPVKFADSGKRLAIVDGSTNGFFWNFTAATLTAIPFPSDIDFVTFQGCDSVAFQDGYFIFNHVGTEQFFISGSVGSIVADDSTIDPLDFSTADANPDSIVSIVSDHENLWLFNDHTVEIWYNSGASAFPFQRVQGAFIEAGCASHSSISKLNNTFAWLGQDDKGHGTVYMAQGYQPQRISTYPVEQAIQSYGDLSTAVAYSYQDNGHSFYVLNFPNANTTWVYDASTQLWHERAYLNNGNLNRHLGSCHAFAYNVHVVGDYQNGNLYQLTDTVYSDNGSAIMRRRVAPHISEDMKRKFYASFQLDIEAGTGLDGTGQGIDPQIMLQFSDDGGHTWSNEKWTGFGKIGETARRALWRKLGTSRDRVFRVTITDPVKTTLIGAEIEVESGVS